MVNLRENKRYAHEVAAKLIEEKRQELENGTSQKDVLSLLGSFCVRLTKLDVRCEIRFSSQGKLLLAARFATERRRNCCASPVGSRPSSVKDIHCSSEVQDDFGSGSRYFDQNGQRFFEDFNSQSI